MAPGAPSGVTLDSAPPQPPGAGRKVSLLDVQAQGGMGSQTAGSPQVMALQGLQMVERGLQILAQTFPDTAPQFADFVSQLRQLTAQGMAGSVGGQPPAGMMPVTGPPPG